MGDLRTSIGEPLRGIERLDRWLAAHPARFDRFKVLDACCWARAFGGVPLQDASSDCNGASNARPNETIFLGRRGFARLCIGQRAEAVGDHDAASKQRPALPWPL